MIDEDEEALSMLHSFEDLEALLVLHSFEDVLLEAWFELDEATILQQKIWETSRSKQELLQVGF